MNIERLLQKKIKTLNIVIQSSKEHAFIFFNFYISGILKKKCDAKWHHYAVASKVCGSGCCVIRHHGAVASKLRHAIPVTFGIIIRFVIPKPQHCILFYYAISSPSSNHNTNASCINGTTSRSFDCKR